MEPNANSNGQQPSEQPLSGSPTQPTGDSSETPVIENPAVESPSQTPEQAVTTGSTEASNPIPATETTATVANEVPAKKLNKPLIITLTLLLTAAVAAAIICFVLLPPNGSDTSKNNNSNNKTPDATYELGEFSDFDLKFLQLENKEVNTIYSPLSIKYALGMLSDAANGDSYNQIYNVIGDFTPKKYTNNDHRSFANAMFIRDRDDIKDRVLDSYIDKIGSKYDASVVYDSFASTDPVNNWVSNKSFGIINNLLTNPIPNNTDFILLNALAIDMNWNNQLQCDERRPKDTITCLRYNVKPVHEKYTDSVEVIREESNIDTEILNGQEVKVADIGATSNRYNIISELGEDNIRTTVQAAYDKWLEENKANIEKYPDDYDADFNIDEYIEELSANYNTQSYSTDFYFYDTDDEKVFAKDLKEYDGSTLQYVAIMPKTENLSKYVSSTTADKIASLISELKDVSQAQSFKDGVVTRFSANIPFFNFDYDLSLKSDLQQLGITDVFDDAKADLSNLATDIDSFTMRPYIQDAIHKANIDFSNDGIKAAAVTAIVGGMGAGHIEKFEYEWDVPVEEIDLSFGKPFLFLIRDKDSGEVWFTGTFYNTTN